MASYELEIVRLYNEPLVDLDETTIEYSSAINNNYFRRKQGPFFGQFRTAVIAEQLVWG